MRSFDLQLNLYLHVTSIQGLTITADFARLKLVGSDTVVYEVSRDIDSRRTEIDDLPANLHLATDIIQLSVTFPWIGPVAFLTQ